MNEFENGRGGLRICCFDGGGVRGLSSILLLERVMAQVNARRKSLNKLEVRPWQLFHLIGGTSTGGLIAIMLGRLRMTATECKDTYIKLMSRVFIKKNQLPVRFFSLRFLQMQSLCDSKNLEMMIIEVLKERGLPPNLPLMQDEHEQGCRTFVCATAYDTRQVSILRSYEISGEPNLFNPTVVEAAMATCAAPPYFDSVEINGCRFSDGAFTANNPVFKAADEARDIWVNNINTNGLGEIQPLVSCMLSIGTGEPELEKLGDTAVDLIKTLVSMTTETNETSSSFMREWTVPRKEKRAFRLNVKQGLGKVGLAEFEAQGLITTCTDHYLRQPEVRDDFVHCVNSLCSDARRNRFKLSVDKRRFAPKQGVYVKRPSILKRMESNLLNDSHERRTAVLYGIAGSGKTQLAYHFYRENEDRFDSAFVVCARSKVEFDRDLALMDEHCSARYGNDEESSLAAIGRNKHSFSSFDKYVEYLNDKENKAWLLLIVDVPSLEAIPDDPNLQEHLSHESYVVAFLKQITQGVVILTSQHKNASRLGTGIDVSEMTKDESISLVRETINGSVLLPEPVLESFVERIGCHAQTVDVASIYLKEKTLGNVKSFLTKWTACEGTPDSPTFNINHKLFLSLRLALDALSTDSRRLVSVLAFLDHRDIWMRLLKSHVECGSWFKQFLEQGSTLEICLQELGNTSFLNAGTETTRSTELESFSLHPTVQALAQSQMKKVPIELQEILNLAIQLVGGEIHQWHSCNPRRSHRRLIPQAIQSYRNLAMLEDHKLRLFEDSLPSLNELGRFFHDNRYSDKARAIYKRIVEEYKTLSCWDSKQRQTYYSTVNSLGLICTSDNEVMQATSCFNEVLSYLEAEFKQGHDVESQFKNVKINLELTTQRVGSDHQLVQLLHEDLANLSSTTISYNIKKHILAVAYRKQGKLEEARNTLEEVRDSLSYIRSHGSDRTRHGNAQTTAASNIKVHEVLIQVSHTFADIHREKQEFEKARQELQNARHKITNHCGENSGFMLDNQWGEVLVLKDEYVKASIRTKDGDNKVFKAFEELLRLQKRRLGVSHFKTLRTMRECGQFLTGLGQWEKAGKILRRTLLAYESSQASSYDLALTSYYLNQLYCDQGDRVKALGYLNKIQILLSQQKNIDAIRTWSILRNRALIKRAQILHQDGTAEEKLQAITQCRLLLGLDPPDRAWVEQMALQYGSHT